VLNEPATHREQLLADAAPSPLLNEPAAHKTHVADELAP